MAVNVLRVAHSDPTISTAASTPQFRIVDTPAPKRDFFVFLTTVVALVFVAFIALFVLNTSMVKMSFEIQQTERAITKAESLEATLEDEILRLSTPAGLTQRSRELGLVPAEDIRHIEVSETSTAE